MNILNEILDRYQMADMKVRLDMFLQYRDVRDEFIPSDKDHDKHGYQREGFASFFGRHLRDSKKKQQCAVRRNEDLLKKGFEKARILKRRLDMGLSSAQSFVQKMKEDREFRENFNRIPDRENFWNSVKEKGFAFDEKDLVKAMAECMNEMEGAC